ncbi:YihY/virulence factor BrkB family protein [Christiangramia fulva]|uniref:YihY/virulence factor BrkB family protein n=1 Tax=Christiangramia fulva TaxID=2126553 RepID=A0A2R3Z156_9FLAO|nr:YihY/virulence factor BrkB family protein [Christiangramia fulva]AVR43992.1 YihY/virulence factor BrkB family protein [Christiangramia fulva]
MKKKGNKRIHNPLKIPFSGWKEILLEVKNEIGADYVGLISGVAFYAFLAIFPAIMALISIYGLTTDPHEIEQQLRQISSMMPEEAFQILQRRIENFIQTYSSSLGVSTIIGLIFSIWSANKGTKSLFKGIDIAYDTVNDRGFFRQVLLAFIFTLFGTVLLALSLALIVGFPAMISHLNLPSNIENLISWMRWPVLALIVTFFLCLVYQHAPYRPRPKFRWVVFGALFSTIIWLLASWGFSFYVSHFGSYGEIYGSVSAVVVMLLWLYITSFIIILGAEINSEIVDYVDGDPDREASYKTRKNKEELQDLR